MARSAKVHVYEARDGWRWRLRAGNGRIVAESGEAYVTEAKALQGFDRVLELVSGLWVERRAS